jgi:hypothetical protein
VASGEGFGVVRDRIEWLVGKDLARGGYVEKCARAKGLLKILHLAASRHFRLCHSLNSLLSRENA